MQSRTHNQPVLRRDSDPAHDDRLDVGWEESPPTRPKSHSNDTEYALTTTMIDSFLSGLQGFTFSGIGYSRLLLLT
jgi:hypothetical protein